MKQLSFRIVFLAVVLIAPAIVRACPNCYGDPDSTMTQGLNVAILILLGVTGTVLGGIVAFIFHLQQRARMINRRFEHMLN